MTNEELNAALIPLKGASDRQLDACAFPIIDRIVEIEDKEQKAQELLFLADNCVCWSWSSDFVVLVLNALLETYCVNNNIDRQAIREREKRVETQLKGL